MVMKLLVSKINKTALVLVSSSIFVVLCVVYIPRIVAINIVSNEPLATSTLPAKRVATHIKTPDAVKAIYMTACVAGTPSWRESMRKLIKETELNAVVIDIKDSTGTISFKKEGLDEVEGTGCVVKDMQDFIDELHKDGIYVAGRISVFQDPLYTKLHPELAVQSKGGGIWKDRKGLSFIDVGARPYWDRIANLAKASYDIGFDEINFDYIRYPSDGNMKDAVYTLSGTSTKPAMLKEFFSYLDTSLRPLGIVISADLFGMTTTNTDDLNIGQLLENTFPHFDYIAPMVYPSHYPPNFNGWPNPNKVPYDIVFFSMKSAEDRLNIYNNTVASTTAKLRPWLQDNDYPVPYTPEMVRAQIKATYDAGLNSWMLWDAGNKYTRGALLSE